MSAGDGSQERTVAVIGPGRVGTTLAAGLVRAGRRVVAVAGGSQASRDELVAHIAGARPMRDPAEAARTARLVLVTTPDDAILEVVSDLAARGAVGAGQQVVHVAGSHGLTVLRRAALAGASVAACHPAQTVPAGAVDPDALVGAAWAVTAAPDDRTWANELVADLGGTPHEVPEDRRVLYHAALTVGSNAVGAVVTVARQLLLGARIDDPAAFLGPLVRASVDNAAADGAAALTGPVVRGDAGTLRQHLEQLDADLPALAGAYRALMGVVLEQARPRLARDTAAALEVVLHERRT